MGLAALPASSKLITLVTEHVMYHKKDATMLNQQTSILQSRYERVSTMRNHKITPIRAIKDLFVQRRSGL